MTLQHRACSLGERRAEPERLCFEMAIRNSETHSETRGAGEMEVLEGVESVIAACRLREALGGFLGSDEFRLLPTSTPRVPADPVARCLRSSLLRLRAACLPAASRAFCCVAFAGEEHRWSLATLGDRWMELTYWPYGNMYCAVS